MHSWHDGHSAGTSSYGLEEGQGPEFQFLGASFTHIYI